MDASDRIREAMKAAEVPSAAELARRTKIKAVTMRAYLNRQFNPPLDVCEKIADVTGFAARWLFEGVPPKRPPPPPPAEGKVSMVPLLDTVTAGRLAEPMSQIPIERVPLLAFADLGPGEWFALKVEGTSMDRLSPEGSTILVNKRDRQLISGRCYVFSIGGETTYKRWQEKRGEDPAYLEPYSTDPFHKPRFVRKRRDFEIIGRVKRTILDL